MEQFQNRDLNILSEGIIVILDSYDHHPYLPDWLFHLWHPRIKQVAAIKAKIATINNAPEKVDKLDELIKTLDKERYFITVHTQSHRLRHKVQDAMVACLFFTPKKAPADPQDYLSFIEQDQELAVYKDYYRKQHSIYGRFIQRFTEEEITMAAKGGMINGKLVDRMGIKGIVAHGLHYIRKELKNLQKQKIERGFLKLAAIEGYLGKMDFLLHPANELQNNEAALVQNARYILEDIMNGASVDENGTARYPDHKPLVAACFWVDEMFITAKSKCEVETMG